MRFPVLLRQLAATSCTVFILLLATAGGPRAQAQATSDGHEVAIFAGGCFWCVESDFDHVPGVVQTVSGFTGGDTVDPSYKQVTAGGTGHREAVQIVFDPQKVSYEKLLDVFWRSVDPTDNAGQFCDRGHSYTTAIYTSDQRQLALANESRQRLMASGKLSAPIVTPIEPAKAFYAAQDYHQDYYRKSPVRYNFYRFSCGRDSRVESLWGDEAYRGIQEH